MESCSKYNTFINDLKYEKQTDLFLQWCFSKIHIKIVNNKYNPQDEKQNATKQDATNKERKGSNPKMVYKVMQTETSGKRDVLTKHILPEKISKPRP